MSNASREERDSLIDTSRMSTGERAALDITEAAREAASLKQLSPVAYSWGGIICLR